MSIIHYYILSYLFCIACFLNIQAQEICNNCIDDDDNGLADCYDPACRNDTSFCNNFYLGKQASENLAVCNYNSDFNFILQEIWSYPTGYGITTPIVGDVDGDGEVEIIIEDDSLRLTILNGRNGISETIGVQGRHLCIGDVDKDGTAEIFRTKNNITIERYEHDFSGPTWATIPAAFAIATGAVALADFDGNDTAEVFASGFIVNAITGKVLVDQKVPNNGFSNMSTIAVDMLPDNFCFDCDGLELVNGKQILTVNLKTGNLRQEITAPDYLGDGAAAVADFNNDGRLDVIVDADGVVYVYDSWTGKLIGSPFYVPNPVKKGGVPLVGNFDADPELEIGIIDDSYIVIDNDMTLKWENTAVFDKTSGFVVSLLFDFNCDGLNEVVVRGDDGFLNILRGYDGKILARYPCYSPTGSERPAIADINDDGHADIICDCFNGLKAFSGAASDWAPARKVMNQYAYFNVHVNDDLTIPCKQPNHADPSLPRSLNAFMSQAPLFDQEGNACRIDPIYKDAVMQVDTVVYFGCDSASILFSICNTGTDSAILAGLPYTIYIDSGGQKKIWEKAITQNDIGPGECLSFNVVVVAENANLLFYANDDGSDAANAPNFIFPECDFNNNIDEVAFLAAEYPTVQLEEDTTLCIGTNLLLRALADSHVSFRWSTKDTFDNILINKAGSYWVEAISIAGCSKRDTIHIQLKGCEGQLFIPNAFISDGQGVNSRLMLDYKNMELICFSIYNRWGKKVFETKDMIEFWDGHGEPLGTYIYVIELVSFETEAFSQQLYKGTITLLN